MEYLRRQTLGIMVHFADLEKHSRLIGRSPRSRTWNSHFNNCYNWRLSRIDIQGLKAFDVDNDSNIQNISIARQKTNFHCNFWKKIFRIWHKKYHGPRPKFNYGVLCPFQWKNSILEFDSLSKVYSNFEYQSLSSEKNSSENIWLTRNITSYISEWFAVIRILAVKLYLCNINYVEIIIMVKIRTGSSIFILDRNHLASLHITYMWISIAFVYRTIYTGSSSTAMAIK